MFGNLFQEEDTYLSSQQIPTPDSVGDKSGGWDAPPQPRDSCRLAGLWNQGATCYLNSLLQTLFLTPEFRENLFQLTEKELGDLSKKNDPEAKVRVIPLQLQRLFTQLLFSNRHSISTAELTESFGWTNNEELQQHDVQELNRILFSAIEDSLIGTLGQNLIHKLYHGQVVNQIICSECGKISERQEDFVDIPLTVTKESSSLELGLGILYCEMETMDGNNKYYCEQCQKLVTAKKGAKLRSLPPILSFSLLRFSYDFKRMDRFKETGKFAFPKSVDMSAFTENTLPGCDCEYELFSVVIHRGGTHGGHYHAYIRDIDGLGNWIEPCRELVLHQSAKPVPLISIPNKEKEYKTQFESLETDNPCELLAATLAKADNYTLSLDKLCMDFVKHTGVSWNKRFKKQHGPITQFLSRHPEKFVLTSDSCVCLLNSPTSNTETLSSHNEFDLQNGSPEELDIPDKRQGGDSGSLIGGRWFDFDDSDVKPISESDLEKQFMGKESAYMLFYRKKMLQRPQTAWCNPAYNVPDHLLAQVLAENQKLEEDRATYDRNVNQVTLQIHFSYNYDYREGALHPRKDERCFIPLNIDKRKSIAELKTAISELDTNKLLKTNFHIHHLKKLFAGGHLYDHLTEDETQHIKDLPIKDDTKLFIWDGKKVQDKEVPVGAASEPILLTVIYGNPLQFTHAFAKSLTFALFTAAVSQHVGIPVERISMKKLHMSGSETKAMDIICRNPNQTLTDLGLLDGDQLVVEDNSSFGTSLTEWTIAKRNKLFVVVENRCIQTSTEDVFPSVVVETDKDMLVSKVKAIAIEKYGLENIPGGGRLSIEKDGSTHKLPLWEHEKVHNLTLGTDHLLYLEAKQPLQQNQITVFVSFVANPKLTVSDLEVTLNQGSTVADCMAYISSQWNDFLPEDGWHLRKTTWCDLPDDLLDQLSATLEDCQVSHGDKLLCEDGKLPPKGFVHISVWLFPTYISEETTMLSWITSKFQTLWNGTESVSKKEPLNVGTIEISKQASLEELKSQVLALPYFSEQGVSSIHLLRLRLMENKRLTTVLKGLNNSLQKLKLKTSCQIAVQILASEENLRSEELILTVQQRVCDKREYKEPVEVIWDTSQGTSISDLEKTVSSQLIIPVENMMLAKHFPSRCEWLILNEQPLQNNKKTQTARSKRKSQQKPNIQSAPFFISDGDVIGAKNILEEPNDMNDFATEDDDLKRKEFLKPIQPKLKESQSDPSNVQSETKDKSPVNEGRKTRPEVGLTIKVDKFT
ncbi:USP40 [Acanthosepion pharaonis]|uniref:USP40 n=1 Tax=Acanthosepion pharaonis TaxID=158019 RepID=A0A812DBX8_ACAPH|nr:USP40 [Sepia pharaonis]